MNRSVIATLVVLALALSIGGFLGWHLKPVERVETPVYVDRIVEVGTDSVAYVPSDVPSRPAVVIRRQSGPRVPIEDLRRSDGRSERRVVLPDSVPAAVATNPELTTPELVEVRRPIFGTPSVTITTNPVGTTDMISRVYEVPRPSFGASASIALSVDPLAADLKPALSLYASARYKSLAAFGGPVATANGLTARVGVRYSIGL